MQLLSTCTSLRVLAIEPFWCHLLESHFPVARANDYVRAGETYKTLYAKHGAAGDVSKWLFNLEFVDPDSGPIQSRGGALPCNGRPTVTGAASM